MRVDFHSLTKPVGVLRSVAAIFTCTTFILVAVDGSSSYPYQAWCMFTWGFCFLVTLLILILEFSTLNLKSPIAWEDLTAAFGVLASLMCLSASIIFSMAFTSSALGIVACVESWVCCGVYTAEATLVYLRPRGQIGGFLYTLPGVMKMLECFFACLIFSSLAQVHYKKDAPLQWCVAVYALCFIFATFIIVLTFFQLFIPFFDKVMTVHNLLATLMYMSAMVLWPLYGFRETDKPSKNVEVSYWDQMVTVTVMTALNLIVYTLDTIYSIRLVFFVRGQ